MVQPTGAGAGALVTDQLAFAIRSGSCEEIRWTVRLGSRYIAIMSPVVT